MSDASSESPTVPEFPVHSSVSVHEGNTIYRTDTWWKAAVLHSIQSQSKEIAIYFWHHDDDDWKRKNKYRVKTIEAWRSDCQLVDEYLAGDGQPMTGHESFPVSDYYTLSQGETVFKTDEWWKAITTVQQKGDYETQEVIFYVWQRVDEAWRRRQKYAIKDADDWADDRDAVNALVDADPDTKESEIQSVSRAKPDKTSAPDDAAKTENSVLEQLQSDIQDAHLGS